MERGAESFLLSLLISVRPFPRWRGAAEPGSYLHRSLCSVLTRLWSPGVFLTADTTLAALVPCNWSSSWTTVARADYLLAACRRLLPDEKPVTMTTCCTCKCVDVICLRWRGPQFSQVIMGIVSLLWKQLGASRREMHHPLLFWIVVAVFGLRWWWGWGGLSISQNRTMVSETKSLSKESFVEFLIDCAH